jgi:hypothetical protein
MSDTIADTMGHLIVLIHHDHILLYVWPLLEPVLFGKFSEDDIFIFLLKCQYFWTGRMPRVAHTRDDQKLVQLSCINNENYSWRSQYSTNNSYHDPYNNHVSAIYVEFNMLPKSYANPCALVEGQAKFRAGIMRSADHC